MTKTSNELILLASILFLCTIELHRLSDMFLHYNKIVHCSLF